jgi:hypothetical protein
VQGHRVDFPGLLALRLYLVPVFRIAGMNKLAEASGGNDALLLWSNPGLALYGVVACSVMVVTITLVLAPGRRGST